MPQADAQAMNAHLAEIWRTVARRYMSLETLARVHDNPNISLPAVAI
jgi:hypothetical protein